MVLPGCDVCCARDLMERLRTVVAGDAVLTPMGQVAISCSVGVASVRMEADTTAEHLPTVQRELLHRAHEALYAAKRNGRNRVELATA